MKSEVNSNSTYNNNQPAVSEGEGEVGKMNARREKKGGQRMDIKLTSNS